MSIPDTPLPPGDSPFHIAGVIYRDGLAYRVIEEEDAMLMLRTAEMKVKELESDLHKKTTAVETMRAELARMREMLAQRESDSAKLLENARANALEAGSLAVKLEERGAEVDRLRGRLAEVVKDAAQNANERDRLQDQLSKAIDNDAQHATNVVNMAIKLDDCNVEIERLREVDRERLKTLSGLVENGAKEEMAHASEVRQLKEEVKDLGEVAGGQANTITKQQAEIGKLKLEVRYAYERGEQAADAQHAAAALALARQMVAMAERLKEAQEYAKALLRHVHDVLAEHDKTTGRNLADHKLRTLQSNLAGQIANPILNQNYEPKPPGKPDITADLDRMQHDLEAMAKGQP